LGITIPIGNARRRQAPAKSRILIVDQHPLVGGVLCEGLAGLGYEVCIARAPTPRCGSAAPAESIAC